MNTGSNFILSGNSANGELPELSISDFYRGKTILCTGCTGFVGKVYLEKILRTLPDVRRIYVLVRPKKGVHPVDRIRKEIFSSKIFDNMRHRMGEQQFEQFFFDKVRPVTGDVSTRDIFLDMDDEQIDAIRREVNIVAHSAATVDFDERLDKSIHLNTYGAKRMCLFARSCPNIDAFCHVSTAYTNANQPHGTTVIEKQVQAYTAHACMQSTVPSFNTNANSPHHDSTPTSSRMASPWLSFATVSRT